MNRFDVNCGLKQRSLLSQMLFNFRAFGSNDVNGDTGDLDIDIPAYHCVHISFVSVKSDVGI